MTNDIEWRVETGNVSNMRSLMKSDVADLPFGLNARAAILRLALLVFSAGSLTTFINSQH